MGKLVLNFVPLLLILAIFSSVFMLSSRIVVKKALSLKLCLGYTFIVLILVAVRKIIISYTGWQLPPLLAVLAGILLNLLIGAYIFGKFGKDSVGNALGYRLGLKTTALGIAFIFVFATITMSALYFLAPAIFQKA